MTTRKYFIDPVGGTDRLPRRWRMWGDAEHRAFRTHEFFRRIFVRDNVLRGDVEVCLLNDFDASNPVIVDFTVDSNASLTYRGLKAPTPLHSGTFTVAQGIDRPNNLAQEIVDASLAGPAPWATQGLVNEPGEPTRRIRITSPVNPDGPWIAYPCRDLGEGRVRTSPFGVLAMGVTGAAAPTQRRFPPQAGVEYQFVVETGFTRIDQFLADVRIRPIAPPLPPKGRLLFVDLELNPDAFHRPEIRALVSGGGQVVPPIAFSGCGLGHLAPRYAHKVVFDFCRCDDTSIQGTLTQLAGCCCLGEIIVFEGARVVAYADTIFQGTPLRVQGLARLGEVSFFDAHGPGNGPPVSGLQIEPNGMVRVAPELKPLGGGQAVYGDGHSGTGVKLHAGACLVYEPKSLSASTGASANAADAGLTVTGNDGNVDVAGMIEAWLNIEPDLEVAGKRAAIARNT